MNDDEATPIYTQAQLDEHIRIVYQAEENLRRRIMEDADALLFGRAAAWMAIGLWLGWLIWAS